MYFQNLEDSENLDNSISQTGNDRNISVNNDDENTGTDETDPAHLTMDRATDGGLPPTELSDLHSDQLTTHTRKGRIIRLSLKFRDKII